MSFFENYDLESCVSPDDHGYRWMKEGLALDPTGIFLHGWADVGSQAVHLTFMRAYMTTYFCC